MKNAPINYRILGKGNPVLFIHGFLESMTMWDVLQLEKMPFQSILVDLPGHGKTNFLKNEPRIAHFSEVLIQLFQEINITPTVVIGHSMGGYVALDLVQKLSNLPHVILLNSNFWADSEKKKSDRNRVIEVVKHNPSLFIHEAIPALFRNPKNNKPEIDGLIEEASELSVEGICWATAAMRDRIDQTEFVRSSSSSFTFVQGASDGLIPIVISEEKCAEIGLPITIIKKAGHMAHLEQTEEVRRLLLEVCLK